jgi:hypothetical protein
MRLIAVDRGKKAAKLQGPHELSRRVSGTKPAIGNPRGALQVALKGSFAMNERLAWRRRPFPKSFGRITSRSPQRTTSHFQIEAR